MLRLELAEPDWDALHRREDVVVFQTREWVEFVARTQHGEPLVARVLDGTSIVGWFVGVRVVRMGVRILGSPFRGWTTHYMGFSLDDGVARADAARALVPFARRELGCLHVELKDRRLFELGWDREATLTFELDLERSEDELFAALTSAARRAYRKSEKEGVTVEEAEAEGFADDYYAQLLDVFAKQGLRPPYGVERVRALVETVPRERLLLLRARDGDGRSIATGIFPGHNGTAYFWGGASLREHQAKRPNEALFWTALRTWKGRGARVLDLGGGGEYKRKYGVTELRVPWFRKSLVPGLATARVLAEKIAARGRR